MKDPAILFYTADFLTGTFTMTNEQVGMYIRLLCLQHHKGIISEKDMLKICETYDETVYEKFVKTDAGYYNERMKFEAEKRKRYSESRAENRAKGIENKDINKHKKVSKSYVNHMENENENENENINEVRIKYTAEFLKFWDKYPRKVGKVKAFIAWKKAKERPELELILKSIDDHLSQEQWQQDNGQYIPHPTTFINEGRWFDELETVDNGYSEYAAKIKLK